MFRLSRAASTLVRRAILKNVKSNNVVRNSSDQATISFEGVKLHKLETGPPSEAVVTKEQALQYYKQMQTIRRMETAAAAMYQAKIIRGFCHLYNGQEAVAVGIRAAMTDRDEIITAYRCHAWAWVMGISVQGILTELAGRSSGCARGKGGSMHMYAPRFYGGNGIVGAQVPLGAGIALANKYANKNGVCVTLYGDGAANQGQVFETYNMSSLWKLPIVYVCENNRYGLGTAYQRASANTDYYTRGDIIPGIWVDGMDVLAVRTVSEFAIKYALENGPIVIEAYTYRYFGHSMSDPGVSYRSRDEIQSVREKQDPIASFVRKCTEASLLSEEEIKKIDEEVQAEVETARKNAESDKEIGLEELTYDVYVKGTPFVRGPSGQRLKHEVKGNPLNVK